MSDQNKDVVPNQNEIDSLAKSFTEIREHLRKLTGIVDALSTQLTNSTTPEPTSRYQMHWKIVDKTVPIVSSANRLECLVFLSNILKNYHWVILDFKNQSWLSSEKFFEKLDSYSLSKEAKEE